MTLKINLILILFCILVSPLRAYNILNNNGNAISIFEEPDTIKKSISPNRVMLRSAVVPGWGQATNKQYWKLPIVYLGYAGCVYVLNFNYSYYRDFRDAYRIRMDGNETTIDKFDPLSNSGEEYYYPDANQLKSIREEYRRNFELSVIVTAGFYTLNLLDAYVNAHLKDFDLSDDLTLEINTPKIYNVKGNNFTTFGLTINF